MIRQLLAVLGLALLAPAAPALAQSVPPPAAAGQPAPLPPLSAQEAADAKTVQTAMAAVPGKGPLALAPYLAELKAIAGRAPASFPLVERRAGWVILRDDVAVKDELYALAREIPLDKLYVSVGFNTYGKANLLLASYANEVRRPDQALQAADAGLKLQPDYAPLLNEKASALVSLHRMAEVPPLLQPWLDAHPQADPRLRGVLLRTVGFSLIELGRLDEAEAAYRQSLTAHPDHPGALAELKYIGDLRAGRGRKPFGLMTSPDAAAGARPKVQDP